MNTLTQYAFPVIGEYRIDAVGTPDVLGMLSPIWLTKPETARRVRQRNGTVMDWAKAAGYRTGDDPVDGVSRGLPKQTDTDRRMSGGLRDRPGTASSPPIARSASGESTTVNNVGCLPPGTSSRDLIHAFPHARFEGVGRAGKGRASSCMICPPRPGLGGMSRWLK